MNSSGNANDKIKLSNHNNLILTTDPSRNGSINNEEPIYFGKQKTNDMSKLPFSGLGAAFRLSGGLANKN